MLQEVCDNLRTAIEHGRTDIIRSLLDACDSDDSDQYITRERILNQPLLEDGTFLCLATKMNQGDVVRTLLSCGADPGVQNSQGVNAVDAAVGSSFMRHIYVEELLRATANSEVGRVCQLVAAGISINARDSEGSKNTPLHWAACYGNRDIVACLLDRGADVNAMNACGATALHDAVFRGDEEIVEELLHNGANPLIQAMKGKFAGKTSLELATHKPELSELIERFTSFSNSLSPSPVAVNGFNHAESEIGEEAGRARSISVESFGSGGIDDRIQQNVRKQSLPPRSHQLPPSQHSVTSAISTLDLSPHIDQAIESLLRTHIGTSPVRPLVTHPSLHLLWPQPQKMLEMEGLPFIPDKELRISVVQGSISIHRILDVWDISRPALFALGSDVKIRDVQPGSGRWTDSQVECLVNPDLFASPDCYQIHVNSKRVRISAGGLSGLHYSLCTFTQMLRLSSGSAVPALLIQDRPVIKHRGVLLDISPRGRVPTLVYLFHMIDLWSSMKVNYLHLYTRLLPTHEWQLCFSRQKMITIDRYCQDRFINLLPVLDVDNSVTYADLADMWPTFQEILANFPNLRYVHVGPKLCSLLMPSPGLEDSHDSGSTCAVLQELWHLLSLPPSVTLMLCGNSLPSAQPLLLPSNMIVVQYGFQADYDFMEWTQNYYKQGTATCLCPGTASWNSLAGCPEASVCNVYRAVQTAVELESLGIVIAHWSGSHHLTPHPFSWPGFIVGSGLAWNPSTHWDYLHNSLPNLMDTHVFLDTMGVCGSAVVGLGRAETCVVRASRGEEGTGTLADLPPQGGSLLYRLLTDPDNVALDNLSVDLFARVTKHIKKCQSNLFRSKLQCEYSEMVVQELQLSADLMLTACRIGRTLIGVGLNPNSNMGLAVINLGICNLPPTFRTDIANKLLAHIEQYKGTWLQRHLPAGLQGSLLVLTSALHRFVPDEKQTT